MLLVPCCKNTFKMKNKNKLILGIAITMLVGFSACKKKAEEVKGCMDPASLSYNAAATVDDGSCAYVEKTQQAFIMDITGTWCPPCGSYGIPAFNYAVRQLGDKVIALSVHSTDGFSNNAADELQNSANYTSNSVPRIAEGSRLLFPAGVYADTAATANQIVGACNTSIGGSPIDVNLYGKTSLSGGSASFDLSVKFFNATSGDFYVTVYAIEDGLVAPQKLADGSTKQDQIHNHVLRGAATTSAFGTSLISGSVDANKIVTKTLTMNVGSWNTSNLRYAGIIWKKEANGTFTFVNGMYLK